MKFSNDEASAAVLSEVVCLVEFTKNPVIFPEVLLYFLSLILQPAVVVKLMSYVNSKLALPMASKLKFRVPITSSCKTPTLLDPAEPIGKK